MGLIRFSVSPCGADPLQESGTWMDEDFDSLARVFSDKRESPIYTRDLTDPLGQDPTSPRKVRAGSENLGDLYPNGENTGEREGTGGESEREGGNELRTCHSECQFDGQELPPCSPLAGETSLHDF